MGSASTLFRSKVNELRFVHLNYLDSLIYFTAKDSRAFLNKGLNKLY